MLRSTYPSAWDSTPTRWRNCRCPNAELQAPCRPTMSHVETPQLKIRRHQKRIRDAYVYEHVWTWLDIQIVDVQLRPRSNTQPNCRNDRFETLDSMSLHLVMTWIDHEKRLVKIKLKDLKELWSNAFNKATHQICHDLPGFAQTSFCQIWKRNSAPCWRSSAACAPGAWSVQAVRPSMTYTTTSDDGSDCRISCTKL